MANAGAPRLTITALGTGAYAVRGDEAFGRAHWLQFLPELNPTNWQILSLAPSNTPTTFEFIDSTAAT